MINKIVLIVVMFFAEFTWIFPSLFNSHSDILVLCSYLSIIAVGFLVIIIANSKNKFFDKEKNDEEN